MKKLMLATALVASAAAFADPTALNAISFEGYNADDTITIGQAEKGEDGNDKTGQENAYGFFYYEGDSDSSSVKTFASGDAGPLNGVTRPYFFAGGAAGSNYLELSTEGGTLWRSINTLPSTADGLGTAEPIAADGTYLDTLVQFTPTEDQGPENDLVDGQDKLAIWLQSSNSTTNLMVRARAWSYNDGEGLTSVVTNFVVSNVSVQPGTWYRLTVKAYQTVVDPEAGAGLFPAFQIFVDGTAVAATEPLFSSGMQTMFAAAWLEGMGDLASANKLFPFITDPPENLQDVTLQGVGFKGSGALDDIVWTEENPFQGPAGIDFTLTWPAGLTAVSYTIDGGEPVAISGASPLAIPNLAGGEAITFIVQNADGVQKTLSATAADGEGIDATSTTFTWADYLGEAVDGAYEIDNLAELKLFQKGIAVTTNELKLATAGETFKLTADIALDAAWPGIGVQNGKDIYSTADFNAAAFQGTFDGQNHTISGFQMVGGGLDYCGFFNSTYGATIQNLKIQYAGGLFAADTSANSSLESGATFVGVAKNSTLRNLTTVAGTVSCDKGFGGIVGYLTSGTLVDSCTNNVNMTSLKPNKCGGIAMITQGGSAVTICNCQNNGSVAGSGEIGSAIGYIGLDVTISNFESTVAYKMFQHQTATVTLQGTIKGNATVDSYTGQATPGLNFATVDGSVATFVADEALAAGYTYKAMHAATATYEFTAAGSISFDTNLIQAVTFAITAAQGLDAPTETTENGVVTFTTAVTPVTVNVTVTGGANATAAWTVAGESVGSAPTTITEGQAWSVTLTADQDYEFDGAATYTTNGIAGAEDFTIVLPDATAQSSGGEDYVVEIEGSNVTITPSAEDLAAVQAAVIAGGGTLDVTDVEAVNAALAAPIGTTGIPSWQALFLGLPPTEAGLESFKIDSISIGPDGKVTVALPASVDPKTGRGVTITLKLKAADTPNAAPADWTDVESASGTTFEPFAPGSTDTKKFYKVVVDFAATPAQN